MQDTLNRRIRFSPPQPLGKRILLSDSDFAIFEAIHRHGPLPTHYLFEFAGRENFTAFQQRLTKLYNGTEHGGYLIRRPEFFDSFHARYTHIVYDLNEQAEQLLSERGKFSPFIHRTDPLIHRLMGACVGASIELGLKDRGLTYLSRSDVLYKNGNQMQLPIKDSFLEPDDLFGIQYENGSKRRFAVEIDRNTEPIEPRKNKTASIDKKFAAYCEVMAHRTYHDVWGIPGMMVLIVTTNASRMKTMIERLKGNEFADRFLFKCYPDFGHHWRVPKTILTDILEPWQTVDKSFDITKS